MARKRAGSIDSDDSTNARAERRAKRTQFLGTRLRGRTDSCYILASALPRRGRLPPREITLQDHRVLRARALDHGRPHRPRPRPRRPVLHRFMASSSQGLEPVARHQQGRVEPRREVLAQRRRRLGDSRGADAASTPPHAIAAALTGSLATQAIIFFFMWAEKSLRRARKQRRSESAEDPDDVESGGRSPQ